jgi:glucose-1-phosphate thymidylyltransferase
LTDLKVVIPAAGGGTRLKPLTDNRPKVMLPVAGKPIIGHIVDLVAGVNPSEVIVIVGSQREQIEDYLDRSFPLRFTFVPQPEPLGLGHAVAQAQGLAAGHPLLIVLGDTVLDVDLPKLVAAGNMLGVRTVPDPRRFGVAELAAGLVKSVVEKPAEPKSNLALVGLYYLTDSTPLFGALAGLIQSNRRTRNEFQLTDALQLMLQAGIAMRPFPVEHWLDCGTFDTLLETNRYLLQRSPAPTRLHSGSTIIPPVFIADSATIENSTVGPDVAIGEHSVIRNSRVRDAIINSGARLENSRLIHSLLGVGARCTGDAEGLVLGDDAVAASGAAGG